MLDKMSSLPGVAIITPKGISFQNVYYTCPRAIRERWFEFAKINGVRRVGILYNPVNSKLIFVVDNEEGFEVCNLIEKHMYKGSKLEKYFRSIEKLKKMRKYYKQQSQ